MKSTLITTIAIAIAGGLSLAMAGTASAATASHPKPHKTKHPVTQITGAQLVKGLLPGSAFGTGTTTSGVTSSGKHLLSSKALAPVSSQNCADLLIDIPVFGQTALAEDSIDTSTLLGGLQSVSQFANSSAAWSFYGQEKSKFNSCTSYSMALKGDQSTGPLSLSIDLQSVSNTKVGKNYAFAVSQLAEVSDSLGDATFSIDTTVVADGTNVYTIWNSNDVDTRVPNSWLSSLISRTQALYKG